MSQSTGYPEIDALVAVIRNYNIHIEPLPETSDEAAISYRRLVLHGGGYQFLIPVDDEYNDVLNGSQNIALMLHLVLRACINFKEAEDYLVWCKETGMPADQPGLRQMYFELRESATGILMMINEQAQPLSDWDFTMNTGVTRALRNQA